MLTTIKRLALIALFATAAVPASAQDASWDAVVAAAKQEGKLVLYNMSAGAPYFQAVVKSFEQKYGISVDSLDLRASELVERIRTEQSAGRFLGDTEMVSKLDPEIAKLEQSKLLGTTDATKMDKTLALAKQIYP